MRKAALILAIIGGFLGLPAAICSGMCAAGLAAVGSLEVDEQGQLQDSDPNNENSNAAGSAFMFLGIIGSLLAMVGGILTIKPGQLATILILFGLVGNGITLITFNPMSFIVVLLLLLATIFSAAGKVAPKDAVAT